MKHVKMKQSQTVSTNGVNTIPLSEGKVYEVPDHLADSMVENGTAVLMNAKTVMEEVAAADPVDPPETQPEEPPKEPDEPEKKTAPKTKRQRRKRVKAGEYDNKSKAPDENK